MSTGYSSGDPSSTATSATGSTTLEQNSYGAGLNSATRSSIYSNEANRMRSNASSVSS